MTTNPNLQPPLNQQTAIGPHCRACPFYSYCKTHAHCCHDLTKIKRKRRAKPAEHYRGLFPTHPTELE